MDTLGSNEKKIKIVEICKKILSNHVDIIEAMRIINTLNSEHYIDNQGFLRGKSLISQKELSNFCTLFEDETETIPKGNSRRYCAVSFLKEIDEKEYKLLEFYKDDIIEFAKKTLTLLESQ